MSYLNLAPAQFLSSQELPKPRTHTLSDPRAHTFSLLAQATEFPAGRQKYVTTYLQRRGNCHGAEAELECRR